MKILVFGHSNSNGSKLERSTDAWPWVLQRNLEGRGIPTEIIHKMLFAGPSAAEMVRTEVEEHKPDVVVLATSSYGVVVRLVSTHLRERWGPRAGGVAVSVEHFVTRHRRAFRLVRPVRRLVRRTIGTSSIHSVENMTAYYKDCFRVLARFEEVQTIVFGGVGYGPNIENNNPGWETNQNRVYAELKQDALARRFEWLVMEDLIGGPGAKLNFFFPDGIHTNEESQRIAAEAIEPLIKVLARDEASSQR